MPHARFGQSDSMRTQEVASEAVRLIIESKSSKKHWRDKAKLRRDAPKLVDELVRSENLWKGKPTFHRRTIFDSCCGKERNLVTSPLRDQLKYKCLTIVLSPDFLKGLVRNTYASLPNRGMVSMARDVRRAMRSDRKGTKYWAKIDVVKCYANVDHRILLRELRRIIKDRKCLRMIFDQVDGQGPGLGVGLDLSRWLCNRYLARFDHFIKEKLRIPHAYRYMDDVLLMSGNRRKLRKAIQEIERYLWENLRLRIHGGVQIHNSRKKPIVVIGREFRPAGSKKRNGISRKATVVPKRRNRVKLQRTFDKAAKGPMFLWLARRIIAANGILKDTATHAFKRRRRVAHYLAKAKRCVSLHDKAKAAKAAGCSTALSKRGPDS